MEINHNTRRVYYNWFISRWAVHKEGGGNGVTAKRIKDCENVILNDNILWFDVVGRHGLNGIWPWDAMNDKQNYDHAMGNFWGAIYPLLLTGRWHG